MIVDAQESIGNKLLKEVENDEEYQNDSSVVTATIGNHFVANDISMFLVAVNINNESDDNTIMK